MSNLVISKLDKGFKKVVIGRLSKNIIEILKLDRDECNIIFREERLRHIKKHRKDFMSEDDFYKYVDMIPDIIDDPHYVGIHPKKSSIEYIKKIDHQLFIVAIRYKPNGNLSFRSFYKLRKVQLDRYLQSKTVIKITE